MLIVKSGEFCVQRGIPRQDLQAIRAYGRRRRARRRQNGPMMNSTHFASAPDGTDIATITDDLEVHINVRPTVAIVSFDGAVTLDYDDTVDVAAALTQAITILRTRGAGTAYPDDSSRK
jgi:hypothetical protein